MTAKNMKNRTALTLLREPVDRVPIFEAVIDQRFNKYALGLDERSLSMAPADHLRLAHFIHMDLATIPYGSRVPGTNTREKFQKIQPPAHEPVLERIDEYLKILDGTDVGLNVYIHGPFDNTYLSMGYEDFFYTVCDDPGFIEEMMDFFTEDAVRLVEKIKGRGLTTIQIVDDIAYKNGLFINPDLFRKLWFPRMQRIMDSIHSLNIPVIFHSDGDVKYFIEMLIELGIHGVNPLETQCNDIRQIKKEYGGDITLMGNLDVGGVLAYGTPDDVRKEMKDLLRDMMPGGGYIAMSSSSVCECVVPENYMAMVETVLEHGQY